MKNQRLRVHGNADPIRVAGRGRRTRTLNKGFGDTIVVFGCRLYEAYIFFRKKYLPYNRNRSIERRRINMINLRIDLFAIIIGALIGYNFYKKKLDIKIINKINRLINNKK